MKFDNNRKQKKKINIKVIATGFVAITLIGIVGISIGKSSSGNLMGMGFLLDGMSAIETNLNKGFTFITDNFGELINYKKNANKIVELEEETSELEKEIRDLNKKLENVESLDRLKKSLGFVDEKYVANTISASVVAKNDGHWYNSFTIGAGSQDGVKKDSIVVNGDGLVGMIYEVSDNYSKAISLLDSKSSVSFKLDKDSEYKGVITQNSMLETKENYKEQGLIQGYMFDMEYDVLPGDIVSTSGLGLYPEGVPIGEIDKVIDDKNSSMKYVVIKPYANFKDIDNVMIIEPRNLG